MNLHGEIESAVGRAIQSDLRELVPRCTHPNYKLWEHKTLNIHRGVVFLKPAQFLNCDTLHKEIRATVTHEFNLWLSWLRGFAFGAVVVGRTFPDDAERLADCVDPYNNLRGVFQWLVFVADSPLQAFGLHMWAEGYLSPTYRRLVENVNMLGIDCPSFVREKGAFFEFAAGIGKLGVPTFNLRDQ